MAHKTQYNIVEFVEYNKTERMKVIILGRLDEKHLLNAILPFKRI